MFGADVLTSPGIMRAMSPYIRDPGINWLTIAGVSVCWPLVDVTSTIGLAPLTVIVSSTAPMRSSMSSLAANPTPTCRSSRITLWNPASSNRT